MWGGRVLTAPCSRAHRAHVLTVAGRSWQGETGLLGVAATPASAAATPPCPHSARMLLPQGQFRPRLVEPFLPLRLGRCPPGLLQPR